MHVSKGDGAGQNIYSPGQSTVAEAQGAAVAVPAAGDRAGDRAAAQPHTQMCHTWVSQHTGAVG